MIINISKECPRFEKCSVNNCPLHKDYPNLLIDESDSESVCTIEKQVRYRIGSKYPDVLKYQGLKVREWSAKIRYDNLSDDEKKVISERGKEALLKIRSKS